MIKPYPRFRVLSLLATSCSVGDARATPAERLRLRERRNRDGKPFRAAAPHAREGEMRAGEHFLGTELHPSMNF